MAIPAWRWSRWKLVSRSGDNPVRYELHTVDGSAKIKFAVRYLGAYRCMLDGPAVVTWVGEQRTFTSAGDLLLFFAEHLITIPSELPRCVFEHELLLTGLGPDKEGVMEEVLKVLALLWGARTGGDDWFWDMVERIAKAGELGPATLPSRRSAAS